MEETLEITIKDGKLARIVALISFIIGTIILLLYKITNVDVIFFIGFLYVITALFLNAIVFFKLIYNLTICSQCILFQLGNILCMLLNIPITLFYMYLVSINFNIHF